MRTIVRNTAAAAALALGAALSATPAFAVPTVNAFFSIDNGSTWAGIGGSCPNNAGTFCTNAPTTVGSFTFQMSVNSNAPGTATQSNSTNASVQVLNNARTDQTI